MLGHTSSWPPNPASGTGRLGWAMALAMAWHRIGIGLARHSSHCLSAQAEFSRFAPSATVHVLIGDQVWHACVAPVVALRFLPT